MTDRLPKTPRGRNRAVELLRCAIDVFIEYGYEGASLSRIIERSGGSRTVIYQVYGNKEGLFLAALGMMADDVYQAYVSNYHPGRSLREEFEAFGRIFLTGMFTERAVGACRLVFAQSFARRDIGEFFYREGVKKSYQCFARVLQNHVDAPIEELEEAAARFIEMLRGPLLMRILCTPETQVTPEEIEERRHHDRLDERALARDQSRLTRTAPIMGAASRSVDAAPFSCPPAFPEMP